MLGTVLNLCLFGAMLKPGHISPARMITLSWDQRNDLGSLMIAISVDRAEVRQAFLLPKRWNIDKGAISNSDAELLFWNTVV
jgi:hypothetical protein